MRRPPTAAFVRGVCDGLALGLAGGLVLVALVLLRWL